MREAYPSDCPSALAKTPEGQRLYMERCSTCGDWVLMCHLLYKVESPEVFGTNCKPEKL
jgi:hypothetical protein